MTEEQYKKLAKLLGYCPYDIRMDKALGGTRIKDDVEKLYKTVKDIINEEK